MPHYFQDLCLLLETFLYKASLPSLNINHEVSIHCQAVDAPLVTPMDAMLVVGGNRDQQGNGA